MKYIKAVLIWLLIIPFAILNGGLRDCVFEPLLGSRIALPLSGIALSVFIFAMAYIFMPKINGGKISAYVLVGIIWFVLTNLFDLSMVIARNDPVSLFFKMFDITTGNLWSLVTLSSLASPILAARIRKLI